MGQSVTIGQMLLHYRITGKIGEGGMGAVFRAIDTHLDRPVAIKVLPPDKVSDTARKLRFIQEAKTASALRHPNIVVIHDITDDRGQDFIVMELVEGRSLDQLIGRKGLNLSEALGYAVQIAEGLSKAHGAGIIHRDIKPTNIMVTDEGLVKILDFGLAKLSEAADDAGAGPTLTLDQDEKPITEAGFIVGTIAYMSPEQAEGKKVDARSDIFSFGSVVYEMLTGRKAFGRENGTKTLAAVVNEEPKPLSSVNEAIPREVERVLTRCLRKDSQRRWQTMSDLRVELQELKEDSESGKLKIAPAAAIRGKGRTTFVTLTAAVLIVLAGTAAVLKFFYTPETAVAEYDIVPMTFDRGVCLSPTLSEDGSLMAYTSDRNGNLDIWVQRVNGGASLRLTDDPADDAFPSISPDGSQVVFRSERDRGGLYVIGSLEAGGKPTRIADNAFMPRFSPDGRYILYLAAPASLVPELFKANLIPAKGGEPRSILDGFTLGYVGQGGTPVWSPDSRHILFRGQRGDDPKSADWWVASVDGGDPVRTRALENLALTTIVQYPVGWEKDTVYFVSGTTIDGINLFRVPINPKDFTIRGPAAPITTGPGMKVYPCVARDGRVFYSDMNVAMNAYTLEARPDEGLILSEPRRVTQDTMQNFFPSITRDGFRAAFSAFGGAQAGRIEIRLKDLKSGDETKIPVQGIGVGQFPRVSPGGRFVAFRDVVEGRSKTFIFSSSSPGVRLLCEDCLVTGFFPDENAALIRTGFHQLQKMDLRTEEKQIVLSSPQDMILDGRVSPDGNWIAWQAGRMDGQAAVRIARIATSQTGTQKMITIAESDRYLGQPEWSPSGRLLYYLSEGIPRCSIVARPLDALTKEAAGPERIIFTPRDSRLNLNLPKGIGVLGVAANRIIFEGTEATGNIFVARPKDR